MPRYIYVGTQGGRYSTRTKILQHTVDEFGGRYVAIFLF